MSESKTIFSYTGPVDFGETDILLNKLKKTRGFNRLNKTTAKRVYAVMVECLENITKHSVDGKGDHTHKPFLTVNEEEDRVVIISGNLVKSEMAGKLADELDLINHYDDEALTKLYEKIINKDLKQGYNGAGLGFMTMKLKSGYMLEYHFSPVDNSYSSFELKISVNKNIMRKLVISQTSSTPGVNFDPDKRIFEISGESRPPDVGEFYGEILNWFDEYSNHLASSGSGNDPVVFNFDLNYFNSSSAKYILDFCKQIAGVRSKGYNVTVNWHYEDDDMDMLEVGREMSRMAKFPFEYIQKEI
jgi:hypothetical protein